MSDDAATVLTHAEDGILFITLNRPDQRNAVNGAMAEGLMAAYAELDSDDELAVAVLTGAGKGFCAGMDLKAFAQGELGFAADEQGLAEGLRRLATTPEKPVVAAIEGFAVAGGCELALTCDVLVAAKGARIGIPEVKRSLVAAGGALLELPRRIPWHIASELALTGEPIDAQRAYDIGLVNALTAPGQALPVARQMASTIALNAPLALRATKRILREQADWSLDDRWRRQTEIAIGVFQSEDAIEGATAFAERRNPVWRGR